MAENQEHSNLSPKLETHRWISLKLQEKKKMQAAKIVIFINQKEQKLYKLGVLEENSLFTHRFTELETITSDFYQFVRYRTIPNRRGMWKQKRKGGQLISSSQQAKKVGFENSAYPDADPQNLTKKQTDSSTQLNRWWVLGQAEDVHPSVDDKVQCCLKEPSPHPPPHPPYIQTQGGERERERGSR